MPDPNKMFAIYSLIGLVAGLIVGGIISAFLGNYALWLSVVPTIGILIALVIFQINKNKFGL